MSDPPIPGYSTEDLRPRRVGGPERYRSTVDGPVSAVVVASSDGVVLGYLWIADAADAAGFMPREAAGNDAFNAAVYWFDRLRAAKGSGLSPARALTWLRQSAGGNRVGHVVQESDRIVASLTELEADAKNG